MNYNYFQNLASSEKVTLAKVRGSQRVVAYALHEGAIWKRLDFDAGVVTEVRSRDEALTQVGTASALVEGSYFNDRVAKTLYIWLSGSANPNHSFITVTQEYFFSNKGVSLPFDLNCGFDVYWEPMIKELSGFDVELDVLNEGMSAIEGSGSITFYNDQSFWPANFDRVFFDNQICEIYSWHPALEASEAKLIFRGYVDSKSYSSNSIRLTIKDLLYALRSNISLGKISELGLRNDPALDSAKQRMLYGRVEGFLPVNLDRVINSSYPITGMVSLFFNQTSVVGTGTRFKSELVPEDKIVVGGATYTVSRIISDTALELTAVFASNSVGPVEMEVVPSVNKSYINRTWLLAGHSLSEPTFFIELGSTTQRLVLNSTQDLYDGDDLWIGDEDGELVRIDRVINATTVSLAQSTLIIYPIGTPVTRPCVQNVRMNDLELQYNKDYKTDAVSGFLTLSQKAEENRAPVLESTEYMTVVSGNDFFSGSGTKFASYIKPGFKVRPQSTDEFYQVLSVEDDKITLTEPYAGPSFITATALPEKTSVSGLNTFREKYALRSIAGQDLHGRYLKLWDQSGSVAVWFDVGNVGVEEPDHGCNRAIEITTVKPTDSHYVVLQKIKQKLDLDQDAAFTTSINGDILSIEANVMGVRPVAQESDSGFIITSLTRNLQRVICVADVADSLDGQYFTLYDGAGSVAFWIDTDNSGTVEPDHSCDRSVEITTIETDDDVTTVRNKVLAAINADPGFVGASSLGFDGIAVTCEMVGPSTGTVPAYTIERVRDGKSLYELHGKWFALPYHDTPSDKTVAFYFDIDSQGVSAPSTGATSTVEIGTIGAATSEAEFFQLLASAIEANPQFNVDYTDNSLITTGNVASEVTTELHAGTSGLVIEQVQAGVSSNPLAGRILQYKSFVFGESDVLSCDVYGKTVDGTVQGRLLKYAPEIVRDLLIESGSADYVNESSFAQSLNFFPEELSLSIPSNFNDKASTLTFREVINSVNGSVLGVLLQGNDFTLQYAKLRPRSSVSLHLMESDILSFSTESTNSNMILTSIVEYGRKEYDYTTKGENVRSVSKSSATAEYILETAKTKTFDSLCVNEVDARRLANRWSFILEQSSNSFKFSTKLQAVQLQVNDIILVSHRKLYDRVGSEGTFQKLMMVQSISKHGDGVDLECIDLSAAFNRVAKFTGTAQTWNSASSETKLLGGFFKNQDGLIESDPNSFFTNLIW